MRNGTAVCAQATGLFKAEQQAGRMKDDLIRQLQRKEEERAKRQAEELAAMRAEMESHGQVPADVAAQLESLTADATANEVGASELCRELLELEQENMRNAHTLQQLQGQASRTQQELRDARAAANEANAQLVEAQGNLTRASEGVLMTQTEIDEMIHQARKQA